MNRFPRRAAFLACLSLSACGVKTDPTTDVSREAVQGGTQAASAAVSLPATSRCTPSFPLMANPFGTWLGGDVVHSVPVDGQTTMWVFGDTFVSRPNVYSRSGSTMLSSTAAVSTCVNGQFRISYQWNMNSSFALMPVYPNSGNRRRWPEQPHLYAGVLFTALTETVPSSGGLGFSVAGAVLARVRNFSTSSAQWQVESLPLYSGPMALGHGSVVAGAYLYLFGSYQNDNLLARIPLDPLLNSAVTSAVPYLQYYSKSGQWKPGLVVSDMQPMGFSASSGSTFFYNRTLSLWQVVYYDSSVFGGNRIETRTAPNLRGPWSAPKTAYLVPERTPGNAAYRNNVFCYTGFHHPEFSQESSQGDLVLTYACNSTDSNVLLNDFSVYVPKVARVKNPWNN